MAGPSSAAAAEAPKSPLSPRPPAKGAPGRRTELALATYFDVAVVRCLFISHWSEDGVHWALTYLNRRLKGILSGFSEVGTVGGAITTLVDEDYDDEEDGPVAPRKRSNSVPVPHIEVTACAGAGGNGAADEGGDGNGADRDEKSDVLGDSVDSSHHARATSLGGGKRRKKSLISTGMEVTRLKHFKSFVESKILSKSDRSLAGGEDDEEQAPTSPVGVGVAPPSTQEARSAQAGKNSFKRRSSRTSFTEFDPSCSPSAPPTSANASSQPTAASSSCRVSAARLYIVLVWKMGKDMGWSAEKNKERS